MGREVQAFIEFTWKAIYLRVEYIWLEVYFYIISLCEYLAKFFV